MLNFLDFLSSIPLPISDFLKLIVLLLLLALVSFLFIYFNILPVLQKVKIDKKLKLLNTQNYFPSEVIENAMQYYIKQHCKSLIPGKNEGQEYTHSKIQDLLVKINEDIDDPMEHQYLLLLGDSGMGKSTFLIRYYIEYLKMRKRKYDIALLPLYIPEIDELISSVKKKNKTILLLDAMNDDPQLVQNNINRIKELITQTEDFYKIIFTCNPQLFQEVANQAKKKDSNNSRDYNPIEFIKTTFHMIQILPFSKEQIDLYLKNRYQPKERTKYQRAQMVVKNIPGIFTRPIMLHYLDALVHRNINTKYTFEVFRELLSIFVDKEIEKIQSINKNTYWLCLKIIAFRIYNQTDKGNRESISFDQIKMLEAEYNMDIHSICCTSPQILQNLNGRYKFIHKSLMEYLVAESILSGYLPSPNAVLSKQLLLFLYEMLEQDNPFKKTEPPPPALFSYLWSVGLDLRSLEFRQANLKGADLSNIHLIDLNLKGADISDATFYNAQLENIEMAEAKLDNCQFHTVYIENVNMDRSSQIAVHYNKCNVKNTTIANARLNQAIITACKFDQVEMNNTDLTGIELNHCVFHKVNLTNTAIQDANLSKSDYQRCSFANAKMTNTNVTNIILNGCDLSKCDLTQTDFSNSDLKYSVFNSSILNGSIIRCADLSGADFNYVSLQDANLEGSILNGIDLTKSDLSRANLSKVTMNKAKLRWCVMPGINFADTILRGINFYGVNLSAANFHRADLCDTDLRETDLRKANFTGAKLDSSDLRVADMAEAILNFDQLVSLKSFDFARLSFNLFQQIRVDWPDEKPKPMGIRHD